MIPLGNSCQNSSILDPLGGFTNRINSLKISTNMFLGHYLNGEFHWKLIRPFGHVLCCLYYHLQPFLVCFCSTGETLSIVTHTGLSHIGAGGHWPLRSPPPAPVLLPPPHLPWR